jgi:hypothetical protein
VKNNQSYQKSSGRPSSSRRAQPGHINVGGGGAKKGGCLSWLPLAGAAALAAGRTKGWMA